MSSHDIDFRGLPESTEWAATRIVDAAFKVHSALGPGLLESVYQACLAHELEQSSLTVRQQVEIPVVYDGVRLDAALRLDLLVNEQVVIELKAVDKMITLYEAQLLTYLKLSRKRLGFLINFNVSRVRDGIKRFIL